MSTSDWPRADPTLERHYRRLLRAYPRPYRRRHGAEIVTTLLEMAEPGRRRPRPAEAWHLVASGARQRFRLPAGRPLARVAAVLALLAGSAVGAAAGSWAAVQTYTPLPGHGEAAAIHRVAAGQASADITVHTVGGGPISGPEVFTITSITTWDVTQARARLAADGWRPAEVPFPSPDLDLVRDGLHLRVDVLVGDDHATAFTTVRALDNGAWRPLTALGLLLGALAGWLIAAAVAQRRSRPASLTGAAALVVLAAPTWALHDNTVAGFQHPDHGFTVHSVLEPSRFWSYGPLWVNLGLIVAGLLLTAVTVALAATRPGPARHPVREVAS
ncbi:hypothetical protein [Actinoplanes sp. NPDC049802]|uniref:hypothetical protein n=1 Tax=Actinoplanes sp. NPDC049802 TaxID=3154742 RepID=UPI0033E98F93